MREASGVEVGLVGRCERTVEEAHTASAGGNREVHVLSTPALIGWLENAAGAATAGRLPDGHAEVGVHVDVWHRAAAAVGTRVRCEARLVGVVDGRRLTYAVRAEDDGGRLLMDGTLERRIIDLTRLHGGGTR